MLTELRLISDTFNTSNTGIIKSNIPLTFTKTLNKPKIISSNFRQLQNTDTESAEEEGLSIPLIAGAAGGGFLVILFIVFLILVISRRRKRIANEIENRDKDQAQKDNKGDNNSKNNNDKNSKNNSQNNDKQLNPSSIVIDHEKQEQFGGSGEISIDNDDKSDSNPNTNISPFDISNDIAFDRSSRKLVVKTMDQSDTNLNGPTGIPGMNKIKLNNIVSMFNERLKNIKDKHVEMNILDEIKMALGGGKKNNSNSNNYNQRDLASIASKVSKNSSLKSRTSNQSAHKSAANIHNQNIVCYTDEQRDDEIDNHFYKQNIDDLQAERKHHENEEREEKLKEAELERKIEKMKKMNNEAKGLSKVDIGVGDHYNNNSNNNNNGNGNGVKKKLSVNYMAELTDYSMPKEIEIHKAVN